MVVINGFTRYAFNPGKQFTKSHPVSETSRVAMPRQPACSNSLVIRGDRISGKFKQLWLDNRGGYHCDTTQPEMGAVAWTCDQQGTPTCDFRSLFRYDVSGLPGNAVIPSPKLYLYAKINAINGDYVNPTYESTNTALLQKVTGTWNVAGTG